MVALEPGRGRPLRSAAPCRVGGEGGGVGQPRESGDCSSGGGGPKAAWAARRGFYLLPPFPRSRFRAYR